MTTDGALEFREVSLQALWSCKHPGEPVPAEIKQLRTWECVVDLRRVGHCTGNLARGEIVGLAVESAHQGAGIGRKLLLLVVDAFRAAGLDRIWVAAPSDPKTRAYGFYRAVGWVPTGERTPDGSEILELRP
jgi:ribosomal protein S18 acetylase RimI-like enzyme